MSDIDRSEEMAAEAAMLVVSGMTRQDSIEKVKELFFLRDEAQMKEPAEVDFDKDGFISNYWQSDLNPPLTDSYNLKQVSEISKDLIDNFI